MKNKKLFAAALTAALAVSMMGTSVMAYEGKTNFKYTPGTAGPTDPITPGNGETDQNNWMVSYPRNITLMDNNEAATAAEASTKGQALTFKVSQRQAGADQSDKVTADNVGSGITVAAGGWTSGTDITMEGTGNSTVLMNLADAASSKFLAVDDVMMTLNAKTDTDDGFAVIKNGQVAKAVEGETYTATVNFTFTRGA